MSTRKLIWIVAGVLFAAASVAIHYEVKLALHQRAGSVEELRNVKVGERAPEFTLVNLAGDTVPLSAYRGRKAVLVDFWATWCGPCKAALPGLQDLSESYRERDFEVVTVNLKEPPEQVRRFIERKKYTFPVLLDGEGAVAEDYGVHGIPTSVLIDKQGIVRSIYVGNMDDDTVLRHRIDRLMKE